MLGLSLITRAKDSLYQIGRGLKTVAMHTFREPITQVYPDKMPDTHIRGRLALAVNPETSEHLCISCRQCERVCPDKCIEITAHKSPETNKLELIDFKIDHGLCMFCGLCTEVCPTSCIINTNDFEMSEYSREALVYDLRKLTLSQEESGYYFDRKEIPLPKPKPAKAAPAAGAAGAAAKPAAPAAGAAATAAKPAAAADAKPAAEAKPASEAKAEGEAKPAEAKEEKKAEPAEKPAKPAEEKKAEAAEEKKDAEKNDGEEKPKE